MNYSHTFSCKNNINKDVYLQIHKPQHVHTYTVKKLKSAKRHNHNFVFNMDDMQMTFSTIHTETLAHILK